jgi:hypothetical protein
MTDEKIVARANALARQFYALMGYVVPDGYRFDRAPHPHERRCWQMAAVAFWELLSTDIDDALSNLNE